MESIARAAGMADMADPTASDPVKDVELGQKYAHNDSQFRASLPHFRQRSQSNVTEEMLGTFNGHNGGDSTGDQQQSEENQADENHEIIEQDPNEIPWGPEHPCYPHLNPHVPLTSALYLSTRIIRVNRDWMVAGDLAPCFTNIYPEILEPYLPEETFRELVAHINGSLIAAFNPRDAHNWFDAVAGLLTGWLWDDVGATAVKRKLAALERWIADWNASIGVKLDVAVTSLRRTGYTSLDLQIPDPPLGPDVPPAQSVMATTASRAGSVYTETSNWTNTSASRSYLGRFAGAGQAQPEVPPIPVEYLRAMESQGRGIRV